VDEAHNSTIEMKHDGQPGPVSEKLYNRLVAIQNGDEDDKFGWVEVV